MSGCGTKSPVSVNYLKETTFDVPSSCTGLLGGNTHTRRNSS